MTAVVSEQFWFGAAPVLVKEECKSVLVRIEYTVVRSGALRSRTQYRLGISLTLIMPLQAVGDVLHWTAEILGSQVCLDRLVHLAKRQLLAYVSACERLRIWWVWLHGHLLYTSRNDGR